MSKQERLLKTKKSKSGLTFMMYGSYNGKYRIEQRQADSQGVTITTWRFNNGYEARDKWSALSTL